MKVNKDLQKLYERDLDRLLNELNSYHEAEMLWEKRGEISNSAGNLIMHLCCNLQHFVGAVLCQNGYERDRENEFSGRMDKSELEEEIKKTKETLFNYFESATEEDLSYPYPQQPFGYPMSKFQFLLHLYGHLNYHLGQVNYHRRLVRF